MIRHHPIARDVFQAGQLVRENRREQIFGFHSLQWRGDFLSTTLTGQGERARGVPTPADGKHGRIQKRLHKNFANGFAVEIAKDFFKRKGMLRAERKNDGVVSGRRLQFKIERATKPFAK